MNKHHTSFTWRAAILLTATLAVAYAAGQERWRGDQPVARGLLPRLGAELALDGELSEWAAAGSMPMRFASYIAHRHPQREWRGPADAGAELLVAWNEAGLCLAAIVTDDEVVNDREPANYWQQDSLELYVDGRVGPRFMRPGFSTGAYQLFVRPPLGDRPADVAVNPRDGTIEGLRIAGRRTEHGYRLALLIPWAAFPDFKPETGARLGLQVGLNDYDRRDGEINQPLLMTWQAATALFMSPQKFIEWTLVEKVPAEAGTPLGTAAALDAPAQWLDPTAPARVTLDLGTTLAPLVAAAEITVQNWRDEPVAVLPVTIGPSPEPWSGAKIGTTEWNAAAFPDGTYTFEARLSDAQGRTVGITERRILAATRLIPEAQETVERAIEHLGSLDLPAMAESTPLVVGKVMAAAATIERVKRGIASASVPTAVWGMAELAARLALLREGTLPDDAPPLLRLLALASDPQTQVVVEFPWRDATAWQATANVAFNLGPVPLASVSVRALAEAAEDAEPRFFTMRERVVATSTRGHLHFTCFAPNEDIARLALTLAASGAPIAPDRIDALLEAVLAAIPETTTNAEGPPAANLRFLGGDLHTHSFYSDGAPSPLGLAFQSLYAGLDFLVVTDHNTLRGAQELQASMGRFGFAHAVTVGEEITTANEHFNAFPLTEVIDWRGPESEIVAAAQRQNAVIYWCHPGFKPGHPWTVRHLEAGIADTGLRAWEHCPPQYREWKAAGRLPTVVGATDSHCGTFASPGRTLILAASARGEDVASAIRAGRAIMWSAQHPDLLVGSDAMIAASRAALRDAAGRREQAAARIRRTVATLDLAGLLRAGPAAPPEAN